MSKLSDKFKELEIPKKIKIESLKPPMTPKINIINDKPEREDMISFEEIANSSEFKRLVYLIQFGKTHRGKSDDLERKLIKRRQEITVIKEYERGTKQDFKEVVKELKNKLLKQRELVRKWNKLRDYQ